MRSATLSATHGPESTRFPRIPSSMSPRQQTLYLSKLPARASTAGDAAASPAAASDNGESEAEKPLLTEDALRSWLSGVLGDETNANVVKVILLRQKNEGFREALLEMTDAEKAHAAQELIAGRKSLFGLFGVD